MQTKSSLAALNGLLTQREKKKKGTKKKKRIKRYIHVFEEIALEKIAN